MTFLPYQPPDLPPPLPARGVSVGTVIAWVVILLCVAALVFRPKWLLHRPGRLADTPLPSIADTPSTQLQMVSRMALGAKVLAPDAKEGESFVGKIDEAATNPIDQFRAITIIDELSGDKAALERFDEFEKRNKVVRLREDVDALRLLYGKGLDRLSEHQKELLVERHHWFGKVAVSHGLPAEDPRRQAAMSPAGRALMIGGAAFIGGAGLLVAGIVLAIVGIVLAAHGRLRFAYRRSAIEQSGPLVEAFALYLTGMLGFSLLLARLVSSYGLWVEFLLFALLPLALVYLRGRGLGWGEIMHELGWHRGRGFFREIMAGAIGYTAGLPLLAVGFVITAILMKVTGNSATHPIVNQPINGSVDVVQLVLLACVMAPIIEETMFRGALFGHLRARLPWWISAPMVSLVFAAIHPQGWVAIPVLGSIAMVLAGLREWRGSIIASMTGHALNNAVAVLMLVALAG